MSAVIRLHGHTAPHLEHRCSTLASRVMSSMRVHACTCALRPPGRPGLLCGQCHFTRVNRLAALGEPWLFATAQGQPGAGSSAG